jgi:hypothetical protein
MDANAQPHGSARIVAVLLIAVAVAMLGYAVVEGMRSREWWSPGPWTPLAILGVSLVLATSTGDRLKGWRLAVIVGAFCSALVGLVGSALQV